ncbi:MAG: protein-L-isoaspartate(D-aspartate) O-methyltransferase [Zetaproteobacteria bacterium]|nr:MAG: protein-L-isoaspartate(D-aspartate) O-methyltransferase [Zetaproteobacteria bacterium]
MVEELARPRRRMVREQLVARGITDPRVLSAMEAVPRHLFVDEALVARAYHDCALPIGLGQTISQPFMVARMSELLQLSGAEHVLEIGTGCGYQTAVLAMLCRRVFSVERIRLLHDRARQSLRRCRLLHRISLHCGDGLEGWPRHAPFDAVLVTAGGLASPAWMEQLKPGGVLLFPEGRDGVHQLVRRRKLEGGAVEEERFDYCSFVPLLPGVDAA